MSAEPAYLRIGEVAQRTGVSPALLRAWERRYGLLLPTRSAGGFRLYRDDDVERVRRAQTLMAGGVSAAQAARLVLADDDGRRDNAVGLTADELLDALLRLDDVGANLVLDRLFAAYTAETVLVAVVIPALRTIGDRWARGEIGVAEEHFASQVLRGRLLALGRGWDQGNGPATVLACAPGEQHDLPLVMLGLALRARGWRVTFLGADSPLESVGQAATLVRADACVIAAVLPGVLDDRGTELRRLARRHTVVLVGPGADARLASRASARYLDGDPLDVADRLGELVGPRAA